LRLKCFWQNGVKSVSDDEANYIARQLQQQVDRKFAAAPDDLPATEKCILPKRV